MSSPLPFNENSHALKMIQKKHFFQIKCLLITFLLFSAFRDFGQTVQTFTSSGSWICPSGVTSVTVECWGGGGAGGGIQTNGNVKASGGAGGAYAQKVIAVSSGTSYTYTVGLGGTGGTGNGPAGGNSWFSSTSTVLAVGGPGGGAITLQIQVLEPQPAALEQLFIRAETAQQEILTMEPAAAVQGLPEMVDRL